MDVNKNKDATVALDMDVDDDMGMDDNDDVGMDDDKNDTMAMTTIKTVMTM